MKYEVTKNDEGQAILKLGLNHSVTFDAGATVEEICEGVEQLIQAVVGISAFELVTAVLTEWNKPTDAV
jgi:hypothetical protein